MTDYVYKIQNLACQYASISSPVLQVNNLSIEKGSIVFIVGPSGVGKSTILETLGLMNNTIKPQNDTIFKFISNGKEIDFTTIWTRKEKLIADFRKQHMSFIFQNTNLFRTLSVYENIILPSVLQGSDYNEAIKKTRAILEDIANDLKGDKNISEISEGERQRVAFARAMIANYSILLADEPTGNLDMINANNLMEKLKGFLKNNENTAIIVTHDIHQAIRYADKIVLIKKQRFNNSNKTFGRINSDTTLIKENNLWHTENNHEAKYNREELFDYLKTELAE